EWGMSALGPLTFGKKEEQIFLGREIAQHRDFSEDTAVRIDHEVKRIVDEGYLKAKSILTGNRDKLIRIAEALLDREVLDAPEVKLLMQGVELPAKPIVAKPEEKPQTQQVIKPGPLRGSEKPGLSEGEKHATAQDR